MSAPRSLAQLQDEISKLRKDQARLKNEMSKTLSAHDLETKKSKLKELEKIIQEKEATFLAENENATRGKFNSPVHINFAMPKIDFSIKDLAEIKIPEIKYDAASIALLSTRDSTYQSQFHNLLQSHDALSQPEHNYKALVNSFSSKASYYQPEDLSFLPGYLKKIHYLADLPTKERDQAATMLSNLLSRKLKGLTSQQKREIEEIKVHVDFQSRPAVPRLSEQESKGGDAISAQIRALDNKALIYPCGTGVYINTNEMGASIVHERLTHSPQVDGCHIGFSGWHNFDIMATRKSGRGIICDINPENAWFLNNVLIIIRNSENRDAFIESIKKYISRFDANEAAKDDKPFAVRFTNNVSGNPAYRNAQSFSDEIDIELQIETSWLFSEERYQHIRKLALNDKIALLTESIQATKTFLAMTRILQKNGVPIDTLYVSNIYMHCEPKEFIDTIKSLTEDDTYIISAFRAVLRQRMVSRKDLNESNIHDWFNPLQIEDTEDLEDDIASRPKNDDAEYLHGHEPSPLDAEKRNLISDITTRISELESVETDHHKMQIKAETIAALKELKDAVGKNISEPLDKIISVLRYRYPIMDKGVFSIKTKSMLAKYLQKDLPDSDNASEHQLGNKKT